MSVKCKYAPYLGLALRNEAVAEASYYFGKGVLAFVFCELAFDGF